MMLLTTTNIVRRVTGLAIAALIFLTIPAVGSTEPPQGISGSRTFASHLTFRLSPEFSFPTSDYYRPYHALSGFGISLELPVSQSIAVGLSYSRVTAVGTEIIPNYITDFELSRPPLGVNDNDSMRTINWMITAKYHKSIDPAQNRPRYFYVTAGVGRVSDRIKSYRVVSSFTHSRVNFGVIHTNHFIAAIGVGGIAMFSKNIGIDVGGTVKQVFNSTQDFAGHPGTLFDLKAGLVISFPL